MLTKTKELILNKGANGSSQKPISEIEGKAAPNRLPRRQPSHISHVNEYNYIHITNQRDSLPDR